MAWKQYILQKKQISTDAGLTWADAEPYTTRVGDPVATFDSYEECMNMLYRWIPSEIEYCDYQVNANSKAVFSVTPNLYVKPEEEELRKFAVYRYGLDKNYDDDVYITLEETSQFVKGELTDATFFEGVKEIENGAFKGFTNLSSITLSSTITSIGDNAFQNCSKITNISIPNSVITLGQGAFAGCTGLTSATIGNNVTNIGIATFSRCSGLTNVSIGNRVTKIDTNAFSYCDLNYLEIPDNVKTIGPWSFSYNKSLEYFTIGSGVTNIEAAAFYKTISGQGNYNYTITVKAINPPIIDTGNYYRVFGLVRDVSRIYVPLESFELYRNAPGWSYYADKIYPNIE